MSVIILKFGGKLLETPDKIKKAARYILSRREDGCQPVVVVSAIGETTDLYMDLAAQITSYPDERELDMLLSVGERTSMSLLAMAINDTGGCKAISYTGSQVGIITDTRHTKAKILEVRAYRIRETLKKGDIPIIGGFQGVSTEKEITTLGRGGSDATAIALAKALKAESCDLIKETGAIYSADPDLVPEAIPISEIDYRTLSRLTEAGAGVVQPEASKLAEQLEVPLNIIGYNDETSTVVTNKVQNMGALAALVISEPIRICLTDSIEDISDEKCRMIMYHADKYLSVTNVNSSDDTDDHGVILTAIAWQDSFKKNTIDKLISLFDDIDVMVLAFQTDKGNCNFVLKNTDSRKILNEVHKQCIENSLLA